MAAAVFGDFADGNEAQQNLIWRVFMDAAYRSTFLDWPYMAKRLLSYFQSHFAKNIDDPWYSKCWSGFGYEGEAATTARLTNGIFLSGVEV